VLLRSNPRYCFTDSKKEIPDALAPAVATLNKINAVAAIIEYLRAVYLPVPRRLSIMISPI
jgi:hypothetical protein